MGRLGKSKGREQGREEQGVLRRKEEGQEGVRLGADKAKRAAREILR